MSSLGDIVLATSFLENLPKDAKVDWVVRSEFEFVLKGHPKINRLIPFQKKAGLLGFIKLVFALSKEHYDYRIDLHRNLRSTIAFILFSLRDFTSETSGTKHIRISKERIRTLFYYVFKELTPQVFRPTRYWVRFAKIGREVSGDQNALLPPSFQSILDHALIDEETVLLDRGLKAKQYFAIMPAASFPTKEWSPVFYRKLLQLPSFQNLMPLIVGRESDNACIALRDELKKNEIRFKEALTEPNFKKTAILLKHAAFYLGSDTGLAHLAEAVGTQSRVIYGPTRPSIGFGAWRPESKSISLPLVCAPCSKDGKFCYRLTSPYACLKKLTPEKVDEAMK